MIIYDKQRAHTFENNGVVEMSIQTKDEYKSLLCPYKVKNNEKHKECWPNNIFKRNEHCDTCPDFWKNYNTIVYDSILRAEQNPKSNIHLIREDIKRDGGKYVSFYGTTPALLIAATTTIEDYYWMFMDVDRKIHLGSCAGSYEVITDENELSNASILQYMREYDRDSLFKIVEDYLSEHKYDKLITKIYI